MIGLVRLALRRPYTMAIAGMLILLMGFLSAQRMVVDIFPNIDIPVVYVAWNYPGLSAEDMERRVVLVSERSYSTTVNGIERIESLSIPGLGILKVYFTQGTDIGGAISQINAQNNSILRIAPPGITPPSMIRFNASNVPVVQVTLNSKTLPEQQIFDYGINFLRIKLFTIPGLSIPAPYGGKQRQIIVDVDPSKLSAKGFSQMDVVSALQTTNVIVPAGIARIGEREFNVKLNSSPQMVEQFQTLPVGVRDGLTVSLGDVAKVSDSFATQQNAVRINGQRASYMSILKNSDASTIAVVKAIRDILPEVQAQAPEGLELKLDFDQSVFVQGAVDNIVHEAILSSILVSLMILIFLGSWRNTVIVSLSIPLSIAAGVAGLFLTGQTINLMTLGGLALAIGLLVDNATVTIENIHRNQTIGKPLTIAILDGSNEVIQPLTVATLAICIVFFPVLLLTGPSRFLFIPLAITVVLAMLASYVLSFTVVPALARYLLKDHDDHAPKNLGARMSAAFDRGFERVKNGYGNVLALALLKRKFVLGCFALLIAATGVLAPVIGTDFFPTSDVGILKLHVRAPRGMRLEETEKIVAQVEESIREIIPAKELRTINSNIGLPFSLNLAFVPSDNTSGMDAELLISLNPATGQPWNISGWSATSSMPNIPGTLFYFQTADIVSQVLNFGWRRRSISKSRISNFPRAYASAQRILRAIQKIPGVVDPRIAQVLDFPTIQIDVDRQRAARMGIAQRDVANNMLTSLAGSALVGATYYLNPTDRRELYRRRADAGGQDQHDLGRHEFAGQSGGAEHQSEYSAHVAADGAELAGDADRRHRLDEADHDDAIDQPLHRAAGRGRQRQHRQPRSRQRGGRDQEGHCRGAEEPAVDGQDIPARPERGDGNLVPQSRPRIGPRDHPGLRGAGRAVPVLGRPLHHHDGGAGRARRHPLDAGDHRHHDQRRLADGRDHVGRHRGVEFDPGREFRQRSAQPEREPDPIRGGDRGRQDPAPPDPDDGARHDHRHGADGSRSRRGRRAERAARSRRDRRARFCDDCHAHSGADLLHAAAAPVAHLAHSR